MRGYCIIALTKRDGPLPHGRQTLHCSPAAERRHPMNTLAKLVVRFARDESAATAIEYGLIAAGIACAIIAVVGKMGTKLNTTFTSISTALR
jgi:pilus assembly protein Flp/PilA